MPTPSEEPSHQGRVEPHRFYSPCDIPFDRIFFTVMIRSFRDAATSRLFADEDVPRFRGIERQARRRLLLLDGAGTLVDLRQPPGNRLEALKGDRHGQHSI